MTRACSGGEAVQDIVRDVAMDQDTGPGGAVLAHRQEGGLDHVIDELVAEAGRVGHQYLRALTAHLQRDALEVRLRGIGQDAASDRGGTGEGQRADPWIAGQRVTGDGTVAGQHGEHSVR